LKIALFVSLVTHLPEGMPVQSRDVHLRAASARADSRVGIPAETGDERIQIACPDWLRSRGKRVKSSEEATSSSTSSEGTVVAPVSAHTRSLRSAPRTIIGYHGCSREAADSVLAEGRFLPSTRAYDWLGEGVYFWEYAPYRALEWAREKGEPSGGELSVIRATIRLGRCLNLLDIEHIPGLGMIYSSFVETIGPSRLPRNTERGAHFLDREIIDAYCRSVARRTASPFQTVRGTFAEGAPIYPGSKILQKAHTQIAVRDPVCILGVTLVQFP
jgi:hypothetical protein